MKVLDIPRSGKRGNRVWQRNRYCQYSYPAFVPFNPRTPRQVAVRANFGEVSARWRTLTEAQRLVWIAIASTRKTRRRLLQCGRMPGFNYFVQVNVARVNRGLAQVDLPLEFLRALEAEAAGRPDIGSFDQPPIGPALFLRAKQLLEDWREEERRRRLARDWAAYAAEPAAQEVEYAWPAQAELVAEPVWISSPEPN